MIMLNDMILVWWNNLPMYDADKPCKSYLARKHYDTCKVSSLTLHQIIEIWKEESLKFSSIYEMLPTSYLTERKNQIEAELESLKCSLSHIENELFYRENPECKPNKKQ